MPQYPTPYLSVLSSSSGHAGESDYEKPRILEIAEVMQNIDSLDEGKKKQEKAIKKGKEAELQVRKLQVSLNEIRCEVQYFWCDSASSWS